MKLELDSGNAVKKFSGHFGGVDDFVACNLLLYVISMLQGAKNVNRLANGEDVKVVQELLRHANSRITMDIYTQALSPAKRQAQTKIIEMIVPKERRLKRVGPQTDPISRAK